MELKIKVPDKLKPFVVKDKRFKIAYGGRGGAKSHTFADLFIMQVQTQGIKVGCFREYQNSIDDSVHALLRSEITRTGVPGFTVNKTEIDHLNGGGFRFKGLSRSPDAIKSAYGFKRFWVEEAQSTSQSSLELLTPTLREEGSEIWMSLNLMSSADPISQRFIEPFKSIIDRNGFYEDDLHYIIKINYYDNPWFPDVLNKERLHDKDRLPRALYDHIWLGEYNDSVEGSIIPAEWFDAAVDAHKRLGFTPRGLKILSHDPSDEGDDDKAFVVRHGQLVQDADIRKTGDSSEGMDWAIDTALENNVDLFNWDVGGLGISLKRQVSKSFDGTKVEWALFNGAEAVDRPDEYYDGDYTGNVDQRKTNKQVFKNKRAQYYWALRDKFYNTYRAVEKSEYFDPDELISINSEIKCLTALKSEVCRIPKKYNSSGLIQIANKQEMRLLKVKSPNLADSLMMSMRVEKEPEEYIPRYHIPTYSGWMSA